MISQNCPIEPVMLRRRDQSSDDLKAVFSSFDSTCYYDAFWRLESTFISATYDDYGLVSFTPTPVQLRLMYETTGRMMRNFAVVVLGKNPIRQQGFNFEEMLRNQEPALYSSFSDAEYDPLKHAEALDRVWTELMGLAKDRRLFTRSNYNDGFVPIDFAIVSDPAYTYLSGNNQQIVIDCDGLSRDGIERAVYSALKEIVELNSNLQTPSFMSFGTLRLRQVLDTGTIYPAQIDEQPYISSLMQGEFDPGEALVGFKPLIIEREFLMSLNMLNLKIMPIIYATQDYSNALGQAYAKMVKQVSKQIAEARRDDEDEGEG